MQASNLRLVDMFNHYRGHLIFSGLSKGGHGYFFVQLRSGKNSRCLGTPYEAECYIDALLAKAAKQHLFLNTSGAHAKRLATAAAAMGIAAACKRDTHGWSVVVATDEDTAAIIWANAESK